MSLIKPDQDHTIDFHDAIERVDDTPDNPRADDSLDQVIGRSRRHFLQGSLGTAVGAFFLGGLPAPAARATDVQTLFPGVHNGTIGFKPLPPMLNLEVDGIQVPEGYQATPFFSVGVGGSADQHR